MSSLVSKSQIDKISEMVEFAKKEGAEVLIGGKRAESFQEEVFGPVLPIMKFNTLDEAIALSNDCQFGLTSSVFSENFNNLMKVTNELQFGETYINREHFEAMQGFHAGWKKSGIGGADGKHGMEEFLHTKVVYAKYF